MTACQKKETTVPPAPTPPPDGPRNSIPNAVWGYHEPEAPKLFWQRDLYEHMQQDMDWGLSERAADAPDVILIPAGEAVFGCRVPPRTEQECLPLQRRYVEAFYIDRTETSNDQYQRCVAARQCLPTEFMPIIVNHNLPDRPVLVTYRQAERYCRWRGMRLPTEYEWEKAARGTDGREYAWGREPPSSQRANICGDDCTMHWADAAWNDGYAFTAPVDAFPAGDSPYGVRQMAGNVKEWTTTEQELPQHRFIARGSSWYSDRPELFVFYRQLWRPGVRVDDKGVRCVIDAATLDRQRRKKQQP